MHKLLTDQAGMEMLMLGNEAIARGAIEAGVGLASTYPGTPSSEISLNLFQLSRESELYFEYSTNEKVALEVAAAAANCGLRSFCIMKHVGLNVAADALMTLAYVGVTGGLVILTADDPYMFSSQNEQDNRLFAQFAGLPMLEPSTVAEAKEMIPHAFELSEKLNEPVILRTTTRINHATAPVTLGAIGEPQTKGHFEKNPFAFVTVPAVSRNLHQKLLQNEKAAAQLAEASDFNWVAGEGEAGIICNGVSHGYVNDALKDLGVEGKARVLRLGFSHPLPENRITDFLKQCQKVLVVEEGEPYMEQAAQSIAQKAGLTLPIQGKGETLFSRLFEFDPGMVRQVIADYFGFEYQAPVQVDTDDFPTLPNRPPTLCAGCSHRATFYAAKQAAKGLDVVFPTDIGCYTLGFMPPLAMGDFLLCMGSSVGTSGGFAKATDQRVVAFIGDSTFFHSGIPGLVNAVFNKHRFTLVILDNGTTAMTGHQPHPGVDMDALQMDGFGRVDIESVVRGLGVQHVGVIRPFNLKKSIAALKEALECEGVSVVIAREECVLFRKSKEKRPKIGLPFRVTDKCVDHRACLQELACPAFYLENDRVKIDADLCVGCTVCAQICPEHAIAPIKTGKPS